MFWWKDCENWSIAPDPLWIGEKAVPGWAFASFELDLGATAD
jgi:hypothetical protein